MQLPVDTRGSNGYNAAPITLRGTADGAGNLTLTSRPVAQGTRWLVNYVTVTVAGAGSPTFSWYVDNAALPNLIDGTTDASSAVAPYNPPRMLEQGQVFVGVFAGAPAGAQCSIRIEYDVAPET